MRIAIQTGLALLTLALCATVAPAHYHILLLDKHSVKKDESVTLLYRWGHPYEHQLFHAPEPEKLIVTAPDGKRTDLTKQLEKLKHTTPDKKQVTAFQLKFTPDQRGDYTFVLHAPPIFLEEDGEFVQDSVKVILHVQAQKNWDADEAGTSNKVIPLTRPYGLQPGMMFQAQFFQGERNVAGFKNKKEPKPHSGKLVEVERFNPIPPKQLPPEEHITRTLKTDTNGIASTTLTAPGWWAVTGLADGGSRQHNGKAFPLRARMTLWVYVDEKISSN